MPKKFDWKKRLGRGYFGEVWLVVDLGLQIERAIKIIRPSKIPDHSNFFREAQLLRKVAHPNVVQVEETGTLENGNIYVAMEFLPKGSVEDEVAGANIALTRGKTIMIDMLRGLHHAHTEGVIHRDIKPANILLGNNREGKLSDFGLAIDVKDVRSAIGANQYDYLKHLAPEVMANKKHSILSDIYSCGLTFYRLVNGDSYLQGFSADIHNLVLSGKFPDRKKYRDFVPTVLRKIINKAMNIDPSKRYDSAEKRRHAIEKIEIHIKLFKMVRWV